MTKKLTKPQPKATRPVMPAAYGVPKTAKGMLPWSYVGERMAKSRNYWIATTRPNGRPHVMPVWGVWVNEEFYFGTDRHSRKGRNLAANPNMIVHLESGDDVVILEGTAAEVTEAALIKKINGAYKKKYGMSPAEAPGDAYVLNLQTRVAFAWTEKEFITNATRWEFPDSKRP